MTRYFLKLKLPVFLCILLFLAACGSGSDGYVQSSVFVTIKDYTHKFPPKARADIPIDIQAFGKRGWEGEISLMLIRKDSILISNKTYVEVEVDSTRSVTLSIDLPEAEGTYEFVAQLEGHEGQPVKSRRLIEIERPIEWDLDTMKIDLNL